MDGGGTFTYFAFASASSDLAIAVGSSRESMSGRFAGLSSVIWSPFLFCFFPSVFPSAILNLSSRASGELHRRERVHPSRTLIKVRARYPDYVGASTKECEVRMSVNR